ncbi:MAG TPA: type I phosphomannose isomerase catalytic subunit [Ktedonosporobacter sp.]|nr:type I phosphomannose isomerase catalytic subunit [Ktedonosporobacter sp.]
MKTPYLYPILLQASLHETIWGGRRLEQASWKKLPPGNVAIGEAWETEVSNSIQNGPYAGQTLGALVDELGPALLGEQALAIFGQRFPLLAKFIDANAQLSVQVHPNDRYAAEHEGGKLGKTEFWYILAAEPGASIVYGFKAPTSRAEVQQAVQHTRLEDLLHEEVVQAGDVIYVPAGTVHAIGSGVLLYELQEYSDVTYRMYDYGRLTASGKPRELHIEQSLDVAHYSVASRVKMKPVPLPGSSQYEDRCLVACQYFLTREIVLKQRGNLPGTLSSQTSHSCIILSSLGAEIKVYYGEALDRYETLSRGESMVLPAALGNYRLEGNGIFLLSYVPEPTDPAWQLWQASNA